jgi:hypothetical protein
MVRIQELEKQCSRHYWVRTSEDEPVAQNGWCDTSSQSPQDLIMRLMIGKTLINMYSARLDIKPDCMQLRPKVQRSPSVDAVPVR